MKEEKKDEEEQEGGVEGGAEGGKGEKESRRMRGNRRRMCSLWDHWDLLSVCIIQPEANITRV